MMLTNIYESILDQESSPFRNLLLMPVWNTHACTENLLMACLWDLVLAVLLVTALLPPSILTDSLLRSTTICLRHLGKKSERVNFLISVLQETNEDCVFVVHCL